MLSQKICWILKKISKLKLWKVGLCEITDECLTRGARNEIHICNSNMNGSSEREAISRHYPNNETLISININRFWIRRKSTLDARFSVFSEWQKLRLLAYIILTALQQNSLFQKSESPNAFHWEKKRKLLYLLYNCFQNIVDDNHISHQ